ncbi:MAG: hypothetical protein WCH04_22425 [Gammaproteobacteria bacterium]
MTQRVGAHINGTGSAVSKRLLWVAYTAGVLLAGYLVWSSGMSGPFHFDDHVTPLNDPASQSLSAWEQHLPDTLRPIAKLSYALEASAGISSQPAPRRVLSLLLHMIAAGLLYLLIARLEPGVAPFGAAFLAMLWFAHPVHADSILLLSGRGAVLSAVFLLAAMLTLERSQSVRAAVLFMLACLSRETALAGLLPLFVLVASRPGVSPRTLLRELAPILAGSVLVLGWILATPRYLDLAEFSFLGRPLWHSFVSQVGAVPVGLELLLQPSGLSIDYGIALPTDARAPLFLLGMFLYIAAAIGVLLFLRRSRTVALGLALWLAALLPTQSVIPKLDALSNRPLSLALAGLLIVTAPILVAACQSTRSAMNRHALYVGFGQGAKICALVLVALLASTTVQRGKVFNTELTLWQDAAAKSQTSARPHLQYAMLLKENGRKQEAWQVLSAAHAIDPFDSRIDDLLKIYRPKEAAP